MKISSNMPVTYKPVEPKPSVKSEEKKDNTRLERLAEQIRMGTYKVDAQAIAKKFLES